MFYSVSVYISVPSPLFVPPATLYCVNWN